MEEEEYIEKLTEYAKPLINLKLSNRKLIERIREKEMKLYWVYITNYDDDGY